MPLWKGRPALLFKQGRNITDLRLVPKFYLRNDELLSVVIRMFANCIRQKRAVLITC